MIRRDLEGKILKSPEDLKIYKEYLDSYYDYFVIVSWRHLMTPVKDLYSKGIFDKEDSSFSLGDAYNNYLVIGKLYQIASQYFNLSGIRVSDNKDKLKDILLKQGYNIDSVISNLIDSFIESYMEMLKYTLNKTGHYIVISPSYNTVTYKKRSFTDN